MDVRIDNKEGHFKLRVAGLLIVDEKLLTVSICDNGFYCLPGGHVHVGESSVCAMTREFKEEVKFKCKVGKCLALIENFFTNKAGEIVHEICYYYLMQPEETVETKDYVFVENDEGVLKELKFAWKDLRELPKIDFRPTVLADKLAKGNLNFEHIIFNNKN